MYKVSLEKDRSALKVYLYNILKTVKAYLIFYFSNTRVCTTVQSAFQHQPDVDLEPKRIKRLPNVRTNKAGGTKLHDTNTWTHERLSIDSIQ